MDNIIENKLNEIIIRAKATKVEFTEKNSKYYANLEKKRAESKIITHLTANGKTTTNQSEIREAQLNFY